MNAQPIYIGDLIFQIDELLIGLLEGLSPNDWEKQTTAPLWKVKDIAVHLLDGNLRTLSMLRDNYYGVKSENIHSYQDLVNFLNTLNADWVNATRRLSPKVIIELLKISGKEYATFLLSLDTEQVAQFPVAWAGESESKNWFHIAREYTEKWHHQQQIRHATIGDKILLTDKYYFPYLDTSVRGLPYHYRNTIGKNGDLIRFTFQGDSDTTWFLRYTQKWELLTSCKEIPTCEVVINNECAWRIFTKGIKKVEAVQKSKIIGNQELGLIFFDMIAVMA